MVWDRPECASPGDRAQVAEILAANGGNLTAPETVQHLAEAGLLGGNQRVFLGRGTDTSAGLHLHDQDGNLRIACEVDADGRASLRVLDASGATVWHVPSDGADAGPTGQD